MAKPLAVDLCCGLGGWSSGLLAEGWDCVGFDIERHQYGEHRYPAQLVLQDIRTLDGRQFRGKVQLIVASPPCQKYSYMAMPWTRAKTLMQWYQDPEHPGRISELNELFDSCLRIGREAECPVVIENVCGAQWWVGRAAWRYGSYYLWGDVPALMPMTKRAAFKGGDRNIGRANGAHQWNTEFNNPARNDPRDEGVKQGGEWWHDTAGLRRFSSRSPGRKAASAMIARIPFALARHIAASWKPQAEAFR